MQLPYLKTIKRRTELTVLLADLAGTFIFALEGAEAAIRGGLDLLGVMVIAFSAALGGGIVRDVLIGAAPPNAIRDWRYPALCFIAGLLAFVFHAHLHALDSRVLVVLDAAGLSLFAVAGVEKAMLFDIGPFVAALMGAITGVGGGVIRDILLTRVPAVLQTDIYATAALLGAIVVLLTRRLGLRPGAAACVGGAACFALRLVAVSRGWHLPRASSW
ncbi:MAG: trimeric intracellular cation channel family protein [Janthinobacterium lividum]